MNSELKQKLTEDVQSVIDRLKPLASEATDKNDKYLVESSLRELEDAQRCLKQLTEASKQDTPLGLEIIITACGRAYYVTNKKFYAACRATQYLSVNKTEGMPPEDRKKGGMFTPGVMLIEHKDGRKWWRDSYPFAIFSFRGRHQHITITPENEEQYLEMISDYACAEGWDAKYMTGKL